MRALIFATIALTAFASKSASAAESSSAAFRVQWIDGAPPQDRPKPDDQLVSALPGGMLFAPSGDYWLSSAIAVDGSDIVSVAEGVNPSDKAAEVRVTFTQAGARKLDRFSTAQTGPTPNAGLAIVLDGYVIWRWGMMFPVSQLRYVVVYASSDTKKAHEVAERLRVIAAATANRL